MVREGVLGAEKGFITTYTKAAQNPASGLSDKCPLCLWEDKDGRIWIGTDGGGINCFDPQTEHFTHYPQTLGEKIVSICPLSETELLASSFSKGIFRFNKRLEATNVSLFRTKMQKQSWQTPVHPPIYELMIKTKSNYMAMLFIDIYPVVNN
mgnify:FL=1